MIARRLCEKTGARTNYDGEFCYRHDYSVSHAVLGGLLSFSAVKQVDPETYVTILN